MTKTRAGKQPAGWLYLPLRWLSRLVCRLFFGLRVTGAGQIPREGPLLVLSAHQGMVDFLLLIAALRRRRIRFVATERQFRHPKLHWFYARLGMIPKVQFHTDARAVMGIFRALRDGGTVGIFPAGQTSMCGVPAGISPAIAHLVKRAGVNVCTVSLNGGFFTYPRFAPWFNRGRTEANLELTFTPDMLKTMSEDEIFGILRRRLDYDDYRWQERTGARFHGRGRARGCENVLLRCPDCGGEGTIRTEKHRIFCLSCGSEGVMGEDMHIAPLKEGSRFFSTLRDWYAWQEHELARAVEQPDFRLSLRVICQRFDPKRFVYAEAGRGTLELDRERIGYRGGFSGEEAEHFLRHGSLPGCAAGPGKYLELYHQGPGLVRYVPEDPAQGWRITLIKTAQELLHRRAAPESVGEKE